jgi:hypothetical protein
MRWETTKMGIKARTQPIAIQCAYILLGREVLYGCVWECGYPRMAILTKRNEQNTIHLSNRSCGTHGYYLQTKPYVMNQLWWETESTAFDEDLVHGYLCVPQISHFDRILSVFLETRDNPGFPAERTHGLAKGNQFCFNFMSIKGEWLGGLDRFATQFFFGVFPYHSILSHAILSWVLSHIYIFSSPISCWETSSILAARRLYQLGKQPFQATTSLGSLVSEVWNGLVMG